MRSIIKIHYPLLLLITLFSCVEEFQPQLKRDNPTVKQSTKTSHCIYWYTVSSEKFNTTTTTSQKFVYSSCADYNSPNQLSEEVTIDTPELITAEGPSFPINPSLNDKYEYTSPEGDYVKYNFTSDRGWRVVERIIPMSLIQKYPDMYLFLNNQNLFDGKVIFGLDDLYYTYEGGLDQWHGTTKKP